MAQVHIRGLHNRAKERLARHGRSPKRLVLLHTAVAALLPLLVLLVNLLLEGQIAKTGGLGGMGMRSMLETAQTTLQYAVTILLPFWQVGLLFAALRWRKGENADKTHLTEGFRRFVNVFALRLWSGILYVVIAIVVLNVSTFLFYATPWAKPAADLLAPTGTAATQEQLQEMLTPELMQQLIHAMKPLFILFGVLYAAACLFLFYRLRFADFILLDAGEGGIRSIAESLRLTRENCKVIFKADLHFWWFYLLYALALALCYGGSILALAGVTLPGGQTLWDLLFYAAGLLLEGVLLYRYQGQRLTTYALVYDTLRAPDPTVLPDDILENG